MPPKIFPPTTPYSTKWILDSLADPSSLTIPDLEAALDRAFGQMRHLQHQYFFYKNTLAAATSAAPNPRGSTTTSSQLPSTRASARIAASNSPFKVSNTSTGAGAGGTIGPSPLSSAPSPAPPSSLTTTKKRKRREGKAAAARTIAAFPPPAPVPAPAPAAGKKRERVSDELKRDMNPEVWVPKHAKRQRKALVRF